MKKEPIPLLRCKSWCRTEISREKVNKREIERREQLQSDRLRGSGLGGRPRRAPAVSSGPRLHSPLIKCSVT